MTSEDQGGLTRLSRSPSISSLTSEENAFNPHANPVLNVSSDITGGGRGGSSTSEKRAAALGVRDLIQIHREEKIKEKRSNSTAPPESPLALVEPLEIQLYGTSTITPTGRSTFSATVEEDGLDFGGGGRGDDDDGNDVGLAFDDEADEDIARYIHVDDRNGNGISGSEYERRVHRPSLSVSGGGEGGDEAGVTIGHGHGPFAKEVEIRGWKVVGGKTWTGAARVGAYVVYDIHISLNSGGNTNILRRYTEFVQLRQALLIKFPAFREAIPSLPGKNHMSKFSPRFLADRQSRLQRFLRGVLLHPVMGKGGSDSVVGQWVTDRRFPES